MPTTEYQTLFERILEFATSSPFSEEFSRAREAHARMAGEVLEEDRSFDARMQAFFDWYLFDRPLSNSDVPARVWAAQAGRSEEERRAARLLCRSVHGLFVAESIRAPALSLKNVVTGARYELSSERVAGIRPGDLFEARLLPWRDALLFSPAFLFHPREIRGRLERSLESLRREGALPAVQDFVWMVARMAARAERFPNIALETIYDFDRPPPLVDHARLRLPG